MKKLISILIFAILFGNYAMAYDFSAVCESEQILYYNITSRTAPYTVEVTYDVYNTYGTVSSSSYCGDIIIPEHVNHNDVEYSVTRIGDVAFGYCYGLNSVTIPNSVTSIGNAAFIQCRFTSITIPNSVEIIDDNAFYCCNELTSVTIPESVTNIGSWAFRYCRGLTSATIGNSVTSIGEAAFEDCINLTSVTIGSSITSIGDYAFSGCSGLTSITIPNSITSIGANTFWNTGWYNNQPDGVLYLDDWCLGYKGNDPNGDLIIDEGTIGIANHAFRDCDITTVTIPNSVTSIGMSFNRNVQINLNPDNTNFKIVDNVLFDYGMTRLIMFMGTQDSYTIPNSVTNIDDEAFYGCSELTSVTIPNSVTRIGNITFQDCSSLTSVTIPNSVTSIEDRAFWGCSGLTSIIIPNSVTIIGDGAFYNCSGLASVTIGNSVTSIGNGAFYNCSVLTSVTIPNSVTNIGEEAFFGCSGLTSITIPNSVTSIGSYAFYDCSGLTSIIIPNLVTSISEGTFYGCSGLTSAIIGNSVTIIGENAFYGCSGLTSVMIPNSVTSIGMEVFNGTGWYEAQSDGILYLDGWCLGYKGNCPNGALTIEEGTKGIVDGAFVVCGLTSVTIPSSVERIGRYTFCINENLDSVSIGRNVESIGYGAFARCTNLRAMSILSPIPPEACYMFMVAGEYSATDNIQLYVGCEARDAYMTSNWGGWFHEIIEIPDCAGVEENSVENEMKLYPNPVVNTLNITSSETISEIEIVNVMGQVVRHIEVNSDNAVCDVEELPNGFYVVRIYNEDTKSFCQKKFAKE